MGVIFVVIGYWMVISDIDEMSVIVFVNFESDLCGELVGEFFISVELCNFFERDKN